MQVDSRSDADVLEEAKGCPIHQLNPMHPALLKQPWGMNSRLRQEAPFSGPWLRYFFRVALRGRGQNGDGPQDLLERHVESNTSPFCYFR